MQSLLQTLCGLSLLPLIPLAPGSMFFTACRMDLIYLSTILACILSIFCHRIKDKKINVGPKQYNSVGKALTCLEVADPGFFSRHPIWSFWNRARNDPCAEPGVTAEHSRFCAPPPKKENKYGSYNFPLTKNKSPVKLIKPQAACN